MPACQQPETLYVKENPCCVLIRAIESCEDIGNSLETIRFNFSNLDAHTCNLEMSAAQLWNPIAALVAEMSAKWQTAYNVVQSMSAAWNSAYTTVAQYSAAFIEPVTVVYPTVFSSDTVSTSLATISAWVVTNYPITSSSASAQCTIVNFAPNQKLWVYCAVQGSTPQVILAQGAATVTNITTQLHIWHQFVDTGVGYCQTIGPYLPPHLRTSDNQGGQWVQKLRRPFVPFVNSEGDANTVMSWGGGVYAGCGWDNVRYTISNPQLYGTYYDTYTEKFAWVEFQNIAGNWTFIRRYY